MSINRAPFDALVDDTGSGTTGTPWNKQAIKDVILDPVDAAIGGAWQAVPFDVANFWPGVTAGMLYTNCYTVINKTMFWIVQLGGAPGPVPAVAALPFLLPNNGVVFNSNAVLSRVTWANDGGVVGAFVGPLAGAANKISVTKDNSAPWGPSDLFVYFTAIIGLV